MLVVRTSDSLLRRVTAGDEHFLPLASHAPGSSRTARTNPPPPAINARAHVYQSDASPVECATAPAAISGNGAKDISSGRRLHAPLPISVIHNDNLAPRGLHGAGSIAPQPARHARRSESTTPSFSLATEAVTFRAFGLRCRRIQSTATDDKLSAARRFTAAARSVAHRAGHFVGASPPSFTRRVGDGWK